MSKQPVLKETPDTIERRAQRSVYPSEALALQLQSAARTYRFSSLVLADSGGNLWAASCRQEASRQLAAALRRNLPARKRRTWSAKHGDRAFTVRRLEVGPATLYLAAPGSQPKAGPALRQTADGVTRILSSLL